MDSRAGIGACACLALAACAGSSGDTPGSAIGTPASAVEPSQASTSASSTTTTTSTAVPTTTTTSTTTTTIEPLPSPTDLANELLISELGSYASEVEALYEDLNQISTQEPSSAAIDLTIEKADEIAESWSGLIDYVTAQLGASPELKLPVLEMAETCLTSARLLSTTFQSGDTSVDIQTPFLACETARSTIEGRLISAVQQLDGLGQ